MNKKAQSTIEYLLLFAVVIAVLVAFLRPGGLFSQNLNKTLEMQADDLLIEADRIFGEN